MQTRNGFSKTFALTLLIGMILVTAAVLNTNRVKAFNPQPDPPAVVFGITREQTARLNVGNRNRASTAPVPVAFIFRDTEGNILAQTIQSVAGGHTISFDLNAGALVTLETGRTELVGEVKFLQPPPEPDRERPGLVSSFEVFDNFGPDAGKTRMGAWANHNETLVSDTEQQ